jgi:hypothetical protein
MDHEALEKRLLAMLLEDWGHIVGSAGLRQALGYPTQAALRAAITRGVLPVKVFEIEGRKGWYALAHDLAAWLAAQGTDPAPAPTGAKKPRRRTLGRH